MTFKDHIILKIIKKGSAIPSSAPNGRAKLCEKTLTEIFIFKLVRDVIKCVNNDDSLKTVWYNILQTCLISTNIFRTALNYRTEIHIQVHRK